MAILGSTQFLERIQFFNGERLFASDLQGLETFAREMRQLHNQSLHQAGVGSGFQVTGNAGDRQVTISPGYALDSCGREIILTEPLVKAIPPVADNGAGAPAFYDLVVSYPSDSQLTASQTRVGICQPAGVVALREAPVFTWVRLSDDPSNHQPVDQRMKDGIRQAIDIVLAQVQIFNCQLKQKVSTIPRRNARPPQHQRIACGNEGSPGWIQGVLGEPAIYQDGGVIVYPSGGTMYVYSGVVRTASAGFQSTPAYTARIVGPRYPFPIANSSDTFMMDAFISIPPNQATATSFPIQIFPLVVQLGYTTPQLSDVNAVINQWTVGWLGVEG